MYKKFVCKRKLKNVCGICRCSFHKKDVYYKRILSSYNWDTEGVYKSTTYVCPRCKYKQEEHDMRFEKFKQRCTHPDEFTEVIWTYIAGECVKEPSLFKM